MFQVFSHADDLRERGIRPKETFLGPLLRRDAPGVSSPVIIANSDTGEETWIVKHQEKGAVEASPILNRANVVFHSPYMLLEDAFDGVQDDLAAAVADITNGDTVTVGSDFALSRYRELSLAVKLNTIRVTAQGAGNHPGGPAQSVDTAAVVKRFGELRERIIPAAAELAKSRAETMQLVDLFDEWSQDTRFDDLNELMKSAQADGVLVVSEINVEELTASSGSFDAALYLRDTDQIWTTHGNVAPLAQRARGSRLLVEENALGVKAAKTLEDQQIELLDGSDHLAKWRERLDHQYLPALVLVTRASRDGLDAATSWALEQVAAGRSVTERDVKDHYLEFVREFVAACGLDGELKEFFSNCHAAQRTLHPALASDHEINNSTSTLKLDSGLALVVDGVTLATSDVASMYIGNEKAKKAENLFRQIVRDTIATKITAGTVFEDIHTYVVDRLYEESDELNKLGFWPNDIDLRDRYGWRNVGHLMGRQESFSSEFRPGDRDVIRVGDYGACEIQWPFAQHAFGVEDMWIVTPQGPVLLTS